MSDVNMNTEKQLRDTLRENIQALSKDEYMSAAQQQEFKTFLISLDSLLVERAKEVKQLIRENRPDGADEADAAQAQTDLESNYQREFAINQQQKAIRTAFEAMRADEYGFCQDCGAEIGLERMISMPWSIRDSDCANLFELKKAQINGRRAA